MACHPRRRALLLRLVLLALFLAGCTQTPTKPAPTVTDGLLDARDWDFANDGPLPLKGDWEVFPEGLLEGAAITEAPSPGDVVALPWSEGHHRTREGTDVDASRWVTLRVKVLVKEPSTGYLVSIPENVVEGFRLTCRSANGTEHTFSAGLEPAPSGLLARPGLWPIGDAALAGSGACVLVAPRAVLGRVRVLDAPRLVPSHLATDAFRAPFALVVTSLVTALAWLAFALTMIAVTPRDPVVRWSAAVALAVLVRVATVNRELLLGPSGMAAVPWLPGVRLEYASLWFLSFTWIRYGESLAERRPPLRTPLAAALAALTLVALLAPYEVNRRLLPLGQLVVVIVAATVAASLARRSRSDRVGRIAFVGVALAGLAAAGDVAVTARSAVSSALFELVGSLEPFFQMAVLAVRAQDARERSAKLAQATLKFVPGQFLHELGHADVTTAKLGDAASRHVTVLFADIRNFTSLSERMSPAETFAFLNACLSRIGPHVRSNAGFVDKYIGDAIMALFPRSPSDAVRAALAMQAEVHASNARHPERLPLAIGVGIHVGEVMMGTIGEAERFEATVISDAVNLTARLESLTKQLGCAVLVSGEVYAALDDGLRTHARRLGSFVVKGKAASVELHELFASDSPDLRDTKLRTRDRFHAMLDAFAAGRVEHALAIGSELRDACPEDGPATWWFLRLTNALASEAGVPSERGVVVLDAK